MRYGKIAYSKVTTDPSNEPVTLAEAKTRLKIDNDDENTDITFMIQAAREAVEQRTNRSLITQSRTMKMDYFPGSDTITLLNGPIQSVTSVKYYNTSEVLTTMSASDYWVDLYADRLIIKNSWPSVYDMPNAVEIIYVAGYGDNASDIPGPLKNAIYMTLAHIHGNREAVVVNGNGIVGAVELPMGAEYLMSSYVLEQSVIY
jgi:uncharacterized phiE125 gp8 family phage protein